MSCKRLLILTILCLAGGCGGDNESAPPATQSRALLPGTYAGEFPCDGCPGIATTLWLRADGRFLFRQQLPADDVHDGTDVFSLGRWDWLAEEDAIELRGAGPRRIFAPAGTDALVMRTASDLEHRLTRRSASTDFSATVPMAGTIRMLGKDASFTECLTGFVAPVTQNGDYARFRHQYRSAAGSGKPVFVELEGHFSWTAEHAPKSMTIDHFLTIKAGRGC